MSDNRVVQKHNQIRWGRIWPGRTMFLFFALLLGSRLADAGDRVLILEPYDSTTSGQYIYHLDGAVGKSKSKDENAAYELIKDEGDDEVPSDRQDVKGEISADGSMDAHIRVSGTGVRFCKDGRFSGGLHFDGRDGYLLIPGFYARNSRAFDFWFRLDELPKQSCVLATRVGDRFELTVDTKGGTDATVGKGEATGSRYCDQARRMDASGVDLESGPWVYRSDDQHDHAVKTGRRYRALLLIKTFRTFLYGRPSNTASCIHAGEIPIPTIFSLPIARFDTL